MKGKNDQRQTPLSPSIVDDKATERLIKPLQDLGLIVNAGGGKPAKPADKKKGGKKALSRWENEGGATTKTAKKGGKE